MDCLPIPFICVSNQLLGTLIDIISFPHTFTPLTLTITIVPPLPATASNFSFCNSSSVAQIKTLVTARLLVQLWVCVPSPDRRFMH